MKKKNNIRYFKNNLMVVAVTASIVVGLGEFIKLYNSKDNIYRDNRLIISEEEQDNLEEQLSAATGKKITVEDNSIVLGAILNNENLEEKEKKLFYKVTDLLEDNPYIDKENAYKNLQDIKIIYDPTADYGKNIVGTYLVFKNEIVIINDNKDNTTLFHEIIHSIYSDSQKKNNLPTFFTEGMTELLTDEYFEEKPFVEVSSYPIEIIMVKILCEMVGSDKLLETYAKNDIKVLEDELRNKLGLSAPHELIKAMDNVCAKSKSKEENDLNRDLNNIQGAFFNYFKDRLEEDPSEYELYLYYQNLLIALKEKSTVDYLNDYLKYLNNNGYYVKPYFSKKLKNKYKKAFKADYGDDYSDNNKIKIYKKNNDNLCI